MKKLLIVLAVLSVILTACSTNSISTNKPDRIQQYSTEPAYIISVNHPAFTGAIEVYVYHYVDTVENVECWFSFGNRVSGLSCLPLE